MKLSSSGIISYQYKSTGPAPLHVWLTFVLVFVLNALLVMGWAYCIYKTIVDTTYWYVLGASVGTMIFVGRDS